jgi:hypothetical protein
MVFLRNTSVWEQTIKLPGGSKVDLGYIKLHEIMKKYFAMKSNQSHRHKCRIDIDVKNVWLNVC